MRPRSCIIDGDTVACGDDGIALFERIRYRRHDASVFSGDDLRREPLERRKAAWHGCLLAQGTGCSSMSTGGRRAGGVRTCVPHGARRDRVEAEGLVI